MNTTMNREIQQYLDYIIADYQNWQNICNGKSNDEVSQRIRKEMFEDFKNGIEVEEGRKYIKVIQSRSVHSFIVKEDGGKFRRGDILKAASWASPAKNFARGNVLEQRYGSVTWPGA